MTDTQAKIIQIEGTVYWPHLFKPSDYGQYEICLGNLTPEAIKILTDNGLGSKVKTDTAEALQAVKDSGKEPFDRGSFIQIRSKDKQFFSVTYADRTPVPSSIMIGNGSKARVGIFVKEYRGEMSGKLHAVVLTELIEFTSGISEEYRAAQENKLYEGLSETKVTKVDDDGDPAAWTGDAED